MCLTVPHDISGLAWETGAGVEQGIFIFNHEPGIVIEKIILQF